MGKNYRQISRWAREHNEATIPRVNKCIFCKRKNFTKATFDFGGVLWDNFRNKEICYWCGEVLEAIFNFYDCKEQTGKHTFKKIHDAIRMFQVERALDGDN